MERRARLLTVVCVACVLSAAPALAADSAPAARPAFEPENAEARAAAAFQRSLTAYDAHDLPSALAAMREAWELSGKDELLYNIGRIEQELERCVDAQASYRSYLERVPSGAYRSQAENAASELSERCPQAPAAAAPAPSAVEPSPPAAVPAAVAPPGPSLPPEPPRVPVAPRATTWPPTALGYGAIALGVVAGASSLYALKQAIDARAAYQAAVDLEKAGGAHADPGKEREQHRNEAWAQVLAVTGGALVASGIVIVVLAPRNDSPAAGSPRLRVTLGQVSLSQSF